MVTRKALVTGASFGIFSDFSCSVNRLGIICDVDVMRGFEPGDLQVSLPSQRNRHVSLVVRDFCVI